MPTEILKHLWEAYIPQGMTVFASIVAGVFILIHKRIKSNGDRITITEEVNQKQEVVLAVIVKEQKTQTDMLKAITTLLMEK